MQQFAGHNEIVTRLYQEVDEKKLFEQMNSDQVAMKERGYEMTKRVKVGRNAPCPCGSRLKFKKCCIHRIGRQHG